MATSSEGDRPWQSYNTAYTNAKAGMDGVDKEKVQRVVYEMSKGSKYFENEQRKEAFIKQKIENLRVQVDLLTDKDISHFQMIANKRIIELEASRDLSKIWLHVDMDAFYAAVETLENPSLRGRPMAVGGLSMISTANYEARKFGVRAGMPGFIACKLCQDLIFVPTNFEKYTFYSELTRKVFRRYDPDFFATSLDEAYLNITEVCISSDEVASELRNAIFEETGLTCSAGVAPNRMLAKVCSDLNKPNGQFILPNDKDAIITFISSLPIRKIGGIGKVTEHILRDALGINTCEDMLQKSAFLCALFSSCSSDFFFSVGLGLGRTDTPERKMRKSISSERTFRATKDEAFLFHKLGDIAETLSIDMQKECLSGRTLTLKLKTASFEIRTRAVSLQTFIHTKEDILKYASRILKAELPISLRLIGLRMSQFRDDKNSNLDPMQKTIVCFLSGECDSPSARSLQKQDCVNSDKLEIQECLDFMEGNSMQDLELDFPASDDHTIERHCDKFCFSEYHHSVSNSVAERRELNDSCVDEFRSNESLQPNEGTHSVESSKHMKEVSLRWIDDYICSVCGIELPVSFIEERLEHLDYHFAQRLEEEESSQRRIHLAPVERCSPKASHARQAPRKKQKCSSKELNHIPIESFFSKFKKNS
ncbi:DNA repair protein REV1 [Platanthera zijinensis]|uniref:DNA polymerase kappa n=1 Tax=Platanthera zijinensis TaxID=2320716 RepID=A0AAP0GF60_9ASPA